MKKIFYLIISFILISCASKKNDNEFEKIIFHTSECFGTCPEYHLEINQKKEVKLYVEKAYEEEIVLSPITFIAIVKGIDNEKATEIFFEKNKELTDSGIIPAIARFGEANEIS